tara:strand:+ start:323 stop:994 length:672 start_codon:yes stop_codon:yes gene_type:complete
MPLQINKKIFFYFFLLIVLTTLNNKTLNNLSVPKISEIKILGLDEKNKIKLSEELKIFKIQNLFFLDKEQLKKVINSNELIEKYSIFKKYPSTLEIKIDKTKFLASTNQNGNSYFVGSNGKLIRSLRLDSDIPFIFGNFDIHNFLEFKRMIDDSNLNFKDIKKIFFFSSGRWDIEMKSGILIKLPENNIQQSLNFYLKILKKEKFKNLKVVDLRQKNQIIIYE